MSLSFTMSGTIIMTDIVKKCFRITISDINIMRNVVIVLSFEKCARKSEKSFEKRRILAA